MKTKKLLSLTLCLCLLVGTVLPLAACKKSDPTPPAGTYTRMTVDINPSVEFMVDDQNKVVSVTALNDDGSILIAGEAFVGKTPEEATQLVVSLATDAGYLVKGEITSKNTEDSQTVSITVSGNSDYAEKLRENVKKDVEKFLSDNKITATVENAKAKTLEEMRKIVVEDGIFTEEEVQNMTEEQLYKALAAGRIETAELLTAEMREAYYRAKDYKISFAERQATLDVINGMDGIYQILLSGYQAALSAYGSAIDTIDDLRYELLVSPDSAYQKALAQLRDAKEELLKEKKLMLTVKIGDANYAEISASFKLSEENYNKLLKAVEDAGAAANETIDNALSLMRQCEDSLKELEASFPTEIKTKLSSEAKALEDKVNAAKDGFFAEFEAAHADDIKKAEDDLKAKKQELIAQAKGEK